MEKITPPIIYILKSSKIKPYVQLLLLSVLNMYSDFVACHFDQYINIHIELFINMTIIFHDDFFTHIDNIMFIVFVISVTNYKQL